MHYQCGYIVVVVAP